jgi:hypothetical protein
VIDLASENENAAENQCDSVCATTSMVHMWCHSGNEHHSRRRAEKKNEVLIDVRFLHSVAKYVSPMWSTITMSSEPRLLSVVSDCTVTISSGVVQDLQVYLGT